ncbi:MAG: hypothetical protein U9R50_07600 [Campylobacterota bacterium]|nr:hypothetical protein [Campylobacterota bacterium]
MNSSKITLSLALSSALGISLMASSLQQENLSQDHTYEPGYIAGKGYSLAQGWMINGDLRAGSLQYGYRNPASVNFQGPDDKYQKGDPSINKGHTDSSGLYIIPKISLTSPTYNGFSAKVTGAAATDLDINNENYESRTFVFDGGDREPFAILQELNIKFEHNGNKAVVGREELTTPMIDADDWYMLANSFELAYYTNTMLENSTFNLGYFHKMAGVWDSGAKGTEFHSMSDASFVGAEDKENAKDAGVAFGAYQYNDDTHNLQVWEYYATDLYNMLFAQYDFTQKIGSLSYDVGAQFINWKGVGALADNENRANKIDYSLYSLRFDGSFDNGISFATGTAKYSDGEGQGETLGAWGGYPYFANGMIFHFFEAGTLQNAASYKTQLGYKIMDSLSISGRFTFWDLDDSKSKTKTGEEEDSMSMYGVRLSYSGKEGGYFTGTYEYVDLDNEPRIDSLRLIGGFKF